MLRDARKAVIMASVAFLVSVVLTGIVVSLIPVDTMSSRADQPDYHYVPFAGDALGA